MWRKPGSFNRNDHLPLNNLFLIGVPDGFEIVAMVVHRNNNGLGYGSETYAQSLAEFGVPQHLVGSGGWILKRPIRRSRFCDAMGIYPFLVCRKWDELRNDIENVEETLISICIVTDPLGEYSVEDLRECFPDRMTPFKRHVVIDLRKDWESGVCRHHKRNIRKAKNLLTVQRVSSPSQHLDVWAALYSNLVKRHNISGIARFSKKSFETQLRVPGIEAFVARNNHEPVGMILWMVHGDIAYYHLGAYSDAGYENSASFALFANALEEFSDRGICLANLGAGAGLVTNASDGLTQFKRGWAKSTRTAYFCGRVCDRDLYDELVARKENIESEYFPAYRTGD